MRFHGNLDRRNQSEQAFLKFGAEEVLHLKYLFWSNPPRNDASKHFVLSRNGTVRLVEPGFQQMKVVIINYKI